MTDATSLYAYLRFPAGHHWRIRHYNFIIECTFGETRRRGQRSSDASVAIAAA